MRLPALALLAAFAVAPATAHGQIWNVAALRIDNSTDCNGRVIPKDGAGETTSVPAWSTRLMVNTKDSWLEFDDAAWRSGLGHLISGDVVVSGSGCKTTFSPFDPFEREAALEGELASLRSSGRNVGSGMRNLLVAGLAAAGGVALLKSWDSDSEEASQNIRPAAAGGAFGLSLGMLIKAQGALRSRRRSAAELERADWIERAELPWIRQLTEPFGR